MAKGEMLLTPHVAQGRADIDERCDRAGVLTSNSRTQQAQAEGTRARREAWGYKAEEVSSPKDCPLLCEIIQSAVASFVKIVDQLSYNSYIYTITDQLVLGFRRDVFRPDELCLLICFRRRQKCEQTQKLCRGKIAQL